MKDKIILVTGSTDGIGKQTAMELAKTGATIIVHGRNAKRVLSTVETVIKSTKNSKIDYCIADFSSLAEVRKMSTEIQKKYDRLDVLINNAGIFQMEHLLSKDGYEMTFAVNYLAHFLLTNSLLDLIKKSEHKRIINVSSRAHYIDLDFSNLQGEKFYDGYDAYSLSKLSNILFTYKLADKLKNDNITVNCLHPGVITSKILYAGWGINGLPVEIGAQTPVYLATSPEVKNITGKYFENMRQVKSAANSYDKNNQVKLWEISEKLITIN